MRTLILVALILLVLALAGVEVAVSRVPPAAPPLPHGYYTGVAAPP